MMAKNYKNVIRDKRIEAGKLMTEKQWNACHGIIHTASVASGAAGAIPIPVADAIPISAAQVTMVVALGKLFDQKLDEGAAKGAIAAAASTFIGRNLVKFIPVAGWIASAAVAAGVTEAIGWTIATDMGKTYRKELKRREAENEAAEAFSKAEFFKESNRYFDSDEEAEDID